MSLTAVLPVFARYADHRFQIGETLDEPFHESIPATVTDDKGHWAIPALPTAVNNLFGQTRSAFNDINSTNDPGSRVMDFQLRFSF